MTTLTIAPACGAGSRGSSSKKNPEGLALVYVPGLAALLGLWQVPRSWRIAHCPKPSQRESPTTLRLLRFPRQLQTKPLPNAATSSHADPRAPRLGCNGNIHIERQLCGRAERQVWAQSCRSTSTHSSRSQMRLLRKQAGVQRRAPRSISHAALLSGWRPQRNPTHNLPSG